MAVWEGYRTLGFIGGREEPAVQRYGYGYLQGINAAAKDLSLTDVVVNYWYAGTYTADIAVREKADDWYGNGTQIIFACGGGLYESVQGFRQGIDQRGQKHRFGGDRRAR